MRKQKPRERTAVWHYGITRSNFSVCYLSTRLFHSLTEIVERQKVVRKLAQAKKRLAAAADASSQSLLEAAVFELRVDLNYILVSTLLTHLVPGLHLRDSIILNQRNISHFFLRKSERGHRLMQKKCPSTLNLTRFAVGYEAR